ncbi:MAG: aspartate 1-decarboxylase [Candidatus Omnitrophota bacterium]|nr:aspartate 1-decarboxylase [Candidatus Omnitrophota bacterium]
MQRIMLKSKIHRAIVTQAELHYQGSISIDSLLMKKADILPGEKVEVFNLNNGSRLETYAIAAKAGTGTICLNGAAARSACVGDQVIIVTYVMVEDKSARTMKPKIINVDSNNRIKN